MDNFALRKLHEHPGYHPYRTILNEIRERLIGEHEFSTQGSIADASPCTLNSEYFWLATLNRNATKNATKNTAHH